MWLKATKKRRRTVKGIPIFRPADELLIGRVVDDSRKEHAAGKWARVSMEGHRRPGNETDSYSFWRKGGTTCRAARERWLDSPRFGRARATWVSSDMLRPTMSGGWGTLRATTGMRKKGGQGR